TPEIFTLSLHDALPILNILEEFLEFYPGVLLLVSHDRYLLDKLTDQLFIFTDSAKIKIYNGNYSDFKSEEISEEKNKIKKIVEKKIEKDNSKEKKISYKEKKELESLEAVIPEIESKIRFLTNEMNEISDHEALTEIAKDIEKLSSDLSLKEDRWMELSEKAV